MANFNQIVAFMVISLSFPGAILAQQSLRVSPNGKPPMTPVVEVVTGGSRWWHRIFMLWPSPELRILKNEEEFSKSVTLIDYLGSEMGDMVESNDFSAINFASIKMYFEVEIPQNISPEDVLVLNPPMYSRQKAMKKSAPGKSVKPLKLEFGFLKNNDSEPSSILKPVRIVFNLPIVNGIYEISDKEFELPIEISGFNKKLLFIVRIDQKSRKIVLRNVPDGCEKLLI